MELNGIANIKLIIHRAFAEGKMNSKIHKNIDKELDKLKDYMLEYTKDNSITWYDILRKHNK